MTDEYFIVAHNDDGEIIEKRVSKRAWNKTLKDLESQGFRADSYLPLQKDEGPERTAAGNWITPVVIVLLLLVVIGLTAGAFAFALSLLEGVT